MTRLFIETKEFTKQCEELEIDDEALRLLEIDIMRNRTGIRSSPEREDFEKRGYL